MDAREIDFDVIVLGAGPAGCAAAILCAQSALKVALLEREAFPRHRSGETLHPGVEPLLRQLGLDSALQASGFLRHRGNWVRWPSELRFEAFGEDESGPWMGFQAWRSTFDALMLDRARQLGVAVQQPCRATRPLLDGIRVTGVQTTSGPLTARFVIDAAGSGHWLGHKLSLPLRRYSPRLIVRFGYVKGDCAARDEAPALVADEGGWIWIARVRPQLYQWTKLSWLEGPPPKDLIPDELRGLDPSGPIRAADVTWRIITKPAGPGYFLVGDAAALLDPAASHGVLKGLMSGMMAAYLLNKIVSERVSEQEALQEYCQWLAGWFESDVGRLRSLYARLPGCDWTHSTIPDASRTFHHGGAQTFR
jgi:flavin-dependent dehydrogenase